MSSLKAVQDIFQEQYNVVLSQKQTVDDKNPFASLRKENVLQDAKCFNESEINTQKCRNLISQLVYLINQGATFTENESSTLFFQITKLFNCENPILRRLLYLIIKELKNQSSIFIITSSILKDVNSKNDFFRINAIRLIPIIADPSNFFQIERYLQNSLVDKNNSVSVSAMLAGLEMAPQYPELGKKWMNEINTLLSSRQSQNHYHALLLFHEMKKQDLASFYRVLHTLAKSDSYQNPLFTVQMIRFTLEYLQNNEYDSVLLEFLERQLNKSSDMVSIEACKAMSELNFLSNKELQPVMGVLKIFLLSSNTINKFAALKIINKLISNPERQNLLQSTQEIEGLLSENNKSLVCFAISLLLKTCQQNQIDYLLKKVKENISVVSDEFKIEILKSIKQLIRKNASKYKPILNFLTEVLQNDASKEFQQNSIEAIDVCIQYAPECADLALYHLLEFIEDCMYPQIQLQVVQMVGDYVIKLNIYPQSQVINCRFIRYLFNRINLEIAEIRTVCINTLGKFALQFTNLQPQIENVLRQVLNDPDDETRERAAYFLSILEKNNAEKQIEIMNTCFDINQFKDIESYITQNLAQIQSSSDCQKLSFENIQFGNHQPIEQDQDTDVYQQVIEQKPVEKNSSQQMTEFEGYGDVICTSGPIYLTDKNSEYCVSLIKYHFEECIILEFSITNILDDTKIENVDIQLEVASENLKLVEQTNIEQINPKELKKCHLILAKNPNYAIIPSTFTSIMKFKVVEEDNEYDEEYQLEDFEIAVSEYMEPQAISKFDQNWEKLPYEYSQSYQLQYKTIQLATSKIQKHFGLYLNQEKNENQNFKQLCLSGMWYKLQKVMIRCTVGFDDKYGCVVKVQAKSSNELIAQNLSECLQ